MSDKEALLNWSRQVADEAREFGVPIANAYHENVQALLRDRWEGVSIFGKFGMWLTGEKPENSTWF